MQFRTGRGRWLGYTHSRTAPRVATTCILMVAHVARWQGSLANFLVSDRNVLGLRCWLNAVAVARLRMVCLCAVVMAALCCFVRARLAIAMPSVEMVQLYGWVVVPVRMAARPWVRGFHVVSVDPTTWVEVLT